MFLANQMTSVRVFARSSPVVHETGAVMLPIAKRRNLYEPSEGAPGFSQRQGRSPDTRPKSETNALALVRLASMCRLLGVEIESRRGVAA
jgi:hypothetical protein